MAVVIIAPITNSVKNGGKISIALGLLIIICEIVQQFIFYFTILPDDKVHPVLYSVIHLRICGII
jgi:hypothetical protein